MAAVTKFANANTVVTTGWTSPTNAYADDGAYATCAPGKSASVSSDFGFPAFSTSDIPDASAITSIVVEVQWKVSTTGSIDTLGVQLRTAAGAALGSETTETNATTADSLATQTITSGVTVADLRAANGIKARVRADRGNTNTGYTASLDYVKVTVNYTALTTATGAASLTGPTAAGAGAGAATATGAASLTGPSGAAAADATSSATAAGSLDSPDAAAAASASSSATAAASLGWFTVAADVSVVEQSGTSIEGTALIGLGASASASASAAAVGAAALGLTGASAVAGAVAAAGGATTPGLSVAAACAGAALVSAAGVLAGCTGAGAAAGACSATAAALAPAFVCRARQPAEADDDRCGDEWLGLPCCASIFGVCYGI